MVDLALHGRSVSTVFDLLGRDENDMTYALGWGLAKSPRLLDAFAERIAPGVRLTEPVVMLQKHDPGDRGYTDIEILSGELHAIVEAKKGWWLPSAGQLRRYEARLATERRPVQRIVVLTQIGAEEIVRHYLADWAPPPPADAHVIGWADVLRLAETAARKGSLRERYMVDELAGYLRGVADMRDTNSNSVLVVSLNASRWGDHTFISLVENLGRYFFPANGKNWPKMPPNYIAFRYWGKLQSIHHVDGYVIDDRPAIQIAGAPDATWDAPHYFLTLGPAIRPDHDVRTGKGIQRSAHAWADIDLLLTCATITEARDLSRQRLSE